MEIGSWKDGVCKNCGVKGLLKWQCRSWKGSWGIGFCSDLCRGVGLSMPDDKIACGVATLTARVPVYSNPETRYRYLYRCRFCDLGESVMLKPFASLTLFVACRLCWSHCCFDVAGIVGLLWRADSPGLPAEVCGYVGELLLRLAGITPGPVRTLRVVTARADAERLARLFNGAAA